MVVSREATCMADVCILIVFMSEFMDPQGAAEPEVATHNINGRQQILFMSAFVFYIYSFVVLFVLFYTSRG